ncbi:MAG: hypothetical protein KDN20_05765 [Verrucomicrobiae bacterium]|nr:hypothetical protein [Verrucomicrobiae bacterium]
MMNHYLPTLSLSLALIAAASFAPSRVNGQAATTEAGRLVPQFIPGKIYTYVNETTVTMTLPSADGGSAERKVMMGHQAKLVTAARGGGAAGTSIDASTEQLRFVVKSGEREMKYDSADESTKNSSLGQHFEGARQRTVTIEVDDTPKIVRSEEKGGGGPATPMPGMPQFGPEELLQLVSNLLQGFPPDPVKPGGEWTQKGKRSLGQFGEMDFEINYRYVGDETIDGADCAIIEFGGDMKGDVEVSGSQPGSKGGKLGFDGKGLKGRLVFDKLRRVVRESTQTVSMTVDVPGPNQQQIQLPVRQEVSLKLVALQDA